MINPGQTTSGKHYCTFRMGGRLFGFDIRAVKEVNTQTRCTPVAHAPREVCGYVNLRGNIFLVLDLRQLIGMDRIQITPDSRLLIFKSTVGESFGVLVDSIEDIVTLQSGQLDNWRPEFEDTTNSIRAGELIAGIGKLPQELLIVLKPEQLLRMVSSHL
jgi:purine-binding chemotaxis protein CheW